MKAENTNNAGYITLINLGCCNFTGAMPSKQIALELQQLSGRVSQGLRSGEKRDVDQWVVLTISSRMHLTNTAAPFKIGLELFM